MKRLNYFSLGMLAVAATFSACSSSDEVTGDNNDIGGNAKAYLAVNIASTQTRADFDNNTADENGISKIRFFFFDKSGQPYSVKGTDNSIDITDLTSSASTGESSTTAASVAKTYGDIEIQIHKDGKYPVRLIAIANPDESLGKNLSMTQLAALTSDKYNTTTASNFTMSNSVYINETAQSDKTDANGETYTIAANDVVYSNWLGKSNFSNDKNSPIEGNTWDAVEVHVERVLAKVATTFGVVSEGTSNYIKIPSTAESANGYKLTEVDGTTALKVGDTELYAIVSGWDLAAKNSKSHLIKSLNSSYTGWTDTENTLNDGSNYRSYWANSVAFDNNNAVSYTAKYKDTHKTGSQFDYCQENTPTASGTYDKCTKIIVFATLCDNTGKAVEVARYKGVYMTKEQAKAAIASEAKTKIQIADAKSGTYSDLDLTNYISFSKKEGDDVTTRYLSKAIFVGTNGNTSFYTTNANKYIKVNGGNAIQVTDNNKDNVRSAINALLNTYDADVYEGGHTYYFTDIKHIATSGLGEYGIVRNHTYKINIEDIQGYGTPVANEDPTTSDPDNPGSQVSDDDPIIPERPQDNTSYVKAKINVQSWRIVNNGNVTLK